MKSNRFFTKMPDEKAGICPLPMPAVDGVYRNHKENQILSTQRAAVSVPVFDSVAMTAGNGDSQ
jgi:hypothetical protein